MTSFIGSARNGTRTAARAATHVAFCLCVLAAAVPRQAQAGTMWCAAEAGQVSYQSDIRELLDLSKAQLRKYSSRFARVVNAGHDAHIEPSAGSCRMFATPAASKRALDSLRNRVSSQGMTTVTIGAY